MRNIPSSDSSSASPPALLRPLAPLLLMCLGGIRRAVSGPPDFARPLGGMGGAGMSEDTLCTGGGGRGSLLDVCDASILICVLEDLSLGGMAGDLEGEGGMVDKAKREGGVSSGVFTVGSTIDDSGGKLIASLLVLSGLPLPLPSVTMSSVTTSLQVRLHLVALWMSVDLLSSHFFKRKLFT